MNPLTTGRLGIAIDGELAFKVLTEWFGVTFVEFQDEVGHRFGRNGDCDLLSLFDLAFEVEFCCLYDVIDKFADSLSLCDDTVICSTSGPPSIVIEYFKLD
ncbi:hypothetical protein [Methanoculleus sp.]|uniref:hypothetical protein n=1 Tax=Methanoculleus sp. TaxID=90427 RepID=UPI0025F6A68A|nr:hypothetical protein [Methanoculleus sp.]MCK9319409.1 hypothetical protein [Methanoculleus sp.]